MKDTSSSPVLVLLFLIIIATGTIIILSAITRTDSVTLTSQASEPHTIACPVRSHISIKEIDEDGNEIPFVFSRNNTDPILWGFADTINMAPYGDNVIPFNTPEVAEYTANAPDLSFLNVPAADQIYPSEQNITVTVMIDDVNYEIVSRRVQECSIDSNQIWLCGRQDPDFDMHTIQDISLRCDMDLDLEWVIKRRETPASPITQFSDTNPVQFLTSDLNGDGVVSAIDLTIVIESYGQTDPIADVNKDGKINVIDFTLVSESIRNQSTFDNALEKDL